MTGARREQDTAGRKVARQSGPLLKFYLIALGIVEAVVTLVGSAAVLKGLPLAAVLAMFFSGMAVFVYLIRTVSLLARNTPENLMLGEVRDDRYTQIQAARNVGDSRVGEVGYEDAEAVLGPSGSLTTKAVRPEHPPAPESLPPSTRGRATSAIAPSPQETATESRQGSNFGASGSTDALDLSGPSPFDSPNEEDC